MSAAMRSMTARIRARSAATTARSGQSAAGRRLTPADSRQRPGARASPRTAAASSPHRRAGPRSARGRAVPRHHRHRGLPGPTSPPPATHPAPRPAHRGRRRPRSGAPARTRARPRRRSGTIWGRLRCERHGVRCPAETGVPAVKVVGPDVRNAPLRAHGPQTLACARASLQPLPVAMSLGVHGHLDVRARAAGPLSSPFAASVGDRGPPRIAALAD